MQMVRWRKDFLLSIRMDSSKVIMACCILHNMALDHNDIFILEEGDIAADEFRFPPLPVQDSMEETRLKRLGKARRDMITQQYFKCIQWDLCFKTTPSGLIWQVVFYQMYWYIEMTQVLLYPNSQNILAFTQYLQSCQIPFCVQFLVLLMYSILQIGDHS